MRQMEGIKGYVDLILDFVDNALLSITPSQEKMEIKEILILYSHKSCRKDHSVFLLNECSPK